MINHFNYTNRRTIPHKAVRFQIVDGMPKRFTAAFDFAEFDLPADAKVYVEALSGSSKTTPLRFCFGTVAAVVPPDKTELGNLSVDSVVFNVRVIDETTDMGRVLGVCERIRPSGSDNPGETGRLSILPVMATDTLGERVWRLEFANDHLWLEVNSKIIGVKDLAQRNQQFFSLVYPEVVRQVLTEVTLNRGRFEVVNDDGRLARPVASLRRAVAPAKATAPRHRSNQNRPARTSDETWPTGSTKSSADSANSKQFE